MVMNQGKLTYWEDLFSSRLKNPVVTAKVFQLVSGYVAIQSLPQIPKKAAQHNE